MKILKLFVAAVVAVSAAIQPALAQPEEQLEASRAQAQPITTSTLHLSPDGKSLVQLALKRWFLPTSMQHDPAGALVSVWDVGSGQLKWRAYSPANAYAVVSFSPDSRRVLIYGGSSRQEENKPVERKQHAQIWSLESDQPALSLELTERDLFGQIVYLPDGQSLMGLVYEFDGRQMGSTQVKVWDSQTGKLLRIRDDRPQLAQTAGWAVGPGILAVATQQMREDGNNQNQLMAWSFPELALKGTREIGLERAHLMAFSPDGKKIAYMTHQPGGEAILNDEVYLWNLETGSHLTATAPNSPDYRIRAIAFSPDSQTVIAAGLFAESPRKMLGEVWFWNAGTGELERSLNKERKSAMAALQFNLLPDGKSFLAQATVGKIEHRSLEDGELIRIFEERN